MDPVGNVRDFFGCILRYVYEFRIPLDRQRRTINLSALYNKYVLLHDNLCPISSSLSNFIQETFSQNGDISLNKIIRNLSRSEEIGHYSFICLIDRNLWTLAT